MKNDTPHLITYPRSGATYLHSLIFHYSGENIGLTHTIDNSVKKVIGIARDPFESMHSAVVMRKHYHENEGFNKSYNNQYIDIYNFLYEKATIVVDYNDLIKFPEKVTKLVCDSVGLIKKTPDHKIILMDNEKESYLVSSKTSQKYNEKHFNIEDIQDCYEPYNRLLSKAVDLTKLLD